MQRDGLAGPVAGAPPQLQRCLQVLRGPGGVAEEAIEEPQAAQQAALAAGIPLAAEDLQRLPVFLQGLVVPAGVPMDLGEVAEHGGLLAAVAQRPLARQGLLEAGERFPGLSQVTQQPAEVVGENGLAPRIARLPQQGEGPLVIAERGAQIAPGLPGEPQVDERERLAVGVRRELPEVQGFLVQLPPRGAGPDGQMRVVEQTSDPAISLAFLSHLPWPASRHVLFPIGN